MGRPPLGGAPVFRFLPTEVAEMERALEESRGANPARETIFFLAEKFSASPERAGKITVQWKQIWNWFQNRRHAQRSKGAKMAVKLNHVSSPFDDSLARRAATSSYAASLGIGRKAPGSPQMEFEARSARDKAWYDVATFLTHRMLEADDPEVKVRFAGFGAEDDEWVNVRKSVRRRSLPCEVSECVAVLEGDLILCFQEGKEQALYFDAHVLKVQRRRHDVRGCRCRFIVRYDHDQCEEVVPLRKVCRRPETDYRLQALYAPRRSAPVMLVQGPQQTKDSSTSKDYRDLQEVPKSSSASMEAIVQSAAIPMSCLSLSDNVHVSAGSVPCLPAVASNLSQNIIPPPGSSVLQFSDSRTDDAAMKLAEQ